MSFLLDDTLLKYVVTEVVLFSIVAFKILTFHKVVQWHTWGVVGSLVTVLLKMFSWFWQRNKFENRSIFYDIKAYKTRVCQFFCCHPVLPNEKHATEWNMALNMERTEQQPIWKCGESAADKTNQRRHLHSERQRV